jgi:hypothetical protein
MSPIHNEAHMANVGTLDLNLVRFFDALMGDRSVRRAGLRLHVIRATKQNFESGERSMSL